MASTTRPFVTVVTPTYNRRRFIPIAIKLYEAQTYPKDRMEWIILDDGVEKVRDLFVEASKRIPNIRYLESDEKLLIGQKRNRLNDEARGDIIVAWDDDDYYPPERVSHVVAKFNQFPKVELAGSSEIYLFYHDIQKIYNAGPYGPNHATNGTMAWRKSYLKTHRYDETVTLAEEKSFLDSYKNPMIQLDPFKVMLVMSHRDNTFDKSKLRDNNPMFRPTDLKLKNFIRDAKIRDFFRDG